MLRRERTRPADLLSPLEAETMAVVWRSPGCNVVDATALVNASRMRKLSERTVATILRRLDAKGYVTHDVNGRAFVYRAVVTESQFVSWHGRRAMGELLRRYGAEVAIAGLIEDEAVDEQTIDALDELIRRRRADAP